MVYLAEYFVAQVTFQIPGHHFLESGTTTTYLSSGIHTLYEKAGTTVNDYVFIGNQIIAKLTSSTIYYLHQDILGNTRLVTSGTSTIFSSNYEPYGIQYGASGTDPTYKYTGKPQDTATGLYYYGARYYNTSIGRFVTRDPSFPPQSDPQAGNPYSYARNNPLKFTDPTGTCVSGIDLTVDCVGFLMDLLGLPRSGQSKSFYDFVTQEWGQTVAPAVGLLQDHNLALFFTSIALPMLSHLVIWYFKHEVWKLNYWDILYLTSQIPDEEVSFPVRLAMAAADFATSFAPDYFLGGGLCLNDFSVGGVQLGGSSSQSSSSLSPSPSSNMVQSGAGGTFSNTSAGVSQAIQQNVATYGSIGMVAVTGPYGEVITPGI